MSERSKAIKLSPLARPFIIGDPFKLHESFDPLNDSSYSSDSIPEQPIPCMNLGGQSQHDGYYAYHSNATAITTFPFVDDLDFGPNSCFTTYPLPATKSSRTGFSLGSSSWGNVGPKTGVQVTATKQQGLEEIPLFEQGTTFEGSKFISATSSVLHENGNVVVGKDNQIRPKGVDKIHTENSVFRLDNSEVNLLNEYMRKSVSISSDVSFSPRPQDTPSQLSYSAPLLTSNVCDSTIINNERCFPHLGSCSDETLASCEPDCVSYSAQTFKPSGASSYNPSIFNPTPLENVAYGGTDAVSNVDSYFGDVVPGMIGSKIVWSPPLDKVACRDLVITEKGEKRNIVESSHNETKNLYIMAKSKIRIACPRVLEDSTLEYHGAKAGIPDDKCSTNSDDDVDSPCWIGTQAYKSPFRDSVPVSSGDSKGQCPSRVSVSLKSKRSFSKNENATCNSLNPLAPVFIPGNSKQNVDYHQKECHGDSYLSLQNVGALSVISSSREHGSMVSFEAGTCHSERINDRGIHCCIDARDSRKEYGTHNNSSRSSAVNSSCSFQPYTGEEYVTSESQLVRGTNIVSYMEGIADVTHSALDGVMNVGCNGPNTSISFPTTQAALISYSIGDGVSSDLAERFQEPSKSTPPKLDAKLLINTIQYLSELLLQNYSFSLGSMSEHEHDKIHNIINNLYVVIRNQTGERAIRPESHHLCTLYGKKQAADHHEIQVMEKDWKVIHSIEPEMPPEALFYRKLWLEAKAALYYQARMACT